MNIIIELVGILAGVLLITSMTFKTSSTKQAILLRIFNALGCFTFVIYGILLPALATALINSILVIINVYHLIKLLKKEK